MLTRTIVITSKDLERLRELIRHSRKSHTEDHAYLLALEQELNQAEVVESGAVPPEVVTMNSTVLVRVDGSRRGQTWTIVYPEHADMDEDRVSVLAPLGTALLGYRVGDTVEWDVPAGRRRYRIAKVIHQPEAAGEFDR
ncbi:nucleoside diphosphate kinase regulator [Phycisphaerales bacterium AB-hyl4]|uniref:Nucleoside diphosphate kinase regulator n=1 Tax=Natronomicrosphaera hydrolytica TaxID=3242702 RepID=A0ABV4U839_9BACT